MSPDGETPERPGPPASGPRPAGDLRVLVVEDDAQDRWYFSEILRSRSFGVISCEDAETAWAVFQDNPTPLVLLDLMLPGMDGLELCRRIRSHPEGEDCIVLAVTGRADPGVVAGILSAGANDFILKPVDPRLLDIRLVIAERWAAEQRARRAMREELAEKTRALEALRHAGGAAPDAPAPAAPAADDPGSLAEQLARKNRELTALVRMAEISLGGSSSAEALEALLREVVQALELPVGAIEHLDRDTGVPVVAATHGVPVPEDPGKETRVQRSLTARAVAEGVPVVETDWSLLEAAAPSYLRSMEPGMVAALPLVAGGVVRGVLVVAAPEARALEPHRRALAVDLATALAAHMERMEAEDALQENEARQKSLVEELQQANTELEAFAHSISHDLRAPLRTMQGFAHALLQDSGEHLDERARDYARRIIASGKDSEALIADLLEYSRLSFEELELRPLELDAVVEAALERVHGDLEASEAEVEVLGPLPPVLASRAILVQIVTNLLSNAVKFVPPGRTPRIVVAADVSETDVRLTVQDNGIGVPPDQAARIFRIFERLQRGERPGTGIGLAIVHRGIQRIGGSCGVESLPGEGARFWIRIPRKRPEPRRHWSRRS